ncbi:lipoprotein [Spiroplasma poulsonii]|uniref:lipoprotein n=1 Tax=Spiroplasma poulsonii TaxID=2138 RepID=UPI001F4C7C14|nr:lipoprotein [Spiroplasma poulsonii]UNF62575.1 lipoprotein [Spiroplasma poulsonii]
MKKILSILGTVSLTVTGTSNIIACRSDDRNNDKQEKENNDDIKTWNKLQVEAKNMFLNELKKEDMVYQINDSTLYSEVSNTNQSKNVNLTGTESNIITQVIENKLDKINNKIKTEYNNFLL